MINPFGVDVPLMEKQGLHKQKTESNLSQIQSHILRNDVGPFFKISFLFRFFSHVFAIANQLPHFSISRSADGKYFLTLFSGPFRHCSRMGGRSPFRKICYTYHTKKRLATIIPYLKKSQKISESRDKLLEFCWHQHFLIGNQQNLQYKKIQI